jgi:hypothetical protein
MTGHDAELSDPEAGGSVLSEQFCLLIISINMITSILLQVIELSDVLIHTVCPLL